jgi:metal-responsive CopG/Arc/MetJ family transcriptional regulator
MGESKAISIRIPDELLAKVNKLAEEKYKSIVGKPNKSLVIQNALVAYFDTLSDSVSNEKIVTVHDTVSIVNFKQLQDFVATLSQDVEQLKKEKITLQDTVIKSDQIKPETKTREGFKSLQLEVLPVAGDIVTIKISADLLAQRLAGYTTGQSITNLKNKCLSMQEFSEKTALADPDGIAWAYSKENKKRSFDYFPKNKLSSELENNLIEWTNKDPIIHE